MTRRPRELDPSASVAAYFGSELRYHRVAAGYTQQELGQLIDYTGALVCMVETCARPPSLDLREGRPHTVYYMRASDADPSRHPVPPARSCLA